MKPSIQSEELREIIEDPERDHCPRSRPVVSFSSEDSPAYLADLRKLGRARCELVRRGVHHGQWTALPPELSPRKISGRKRRMTQLRMRWNAAQPIFLGANEIELPPDQKAARATLSLFHSLTEIPLSQWLQRVDPERQTQALEGADSERDLERLQLGVSGSTPLWVKTSKLSTHDKDRSMRMRFSFGQEGGDDASTDEGAHEAIRAIAQQVLPCGDLLKRDHPLFGLVEELTGVRAFPTQPIVYWNAPQGGARFHHDAFPGEAEEQQMGVLYHQMYGRTAWLALSVNDMALRVREFLEHLTAGEMPWLLEETAGQFDLARATQLASDWKLLLAELVQPNCGEFAALVNRGREFTDFLCDAGYGFILEPGETILLPNFGYERTVLHSVFCASNEVTAALSVALRRDPNQPEPDQAESDRPSSDQIEPSSTSNEATETT